MWDEGKNGGIYIAIFNHLALVLISLAIVYGWQGWATVVMTNGSKVGRGIHPIDVALAVWVVVNPE